MSIFKQQFCSFTFLFSHEVQMNLPTLCIDFYDINSHSLIPYFQTTKINLFH